MTLHSSDTLLVIALVAFVAVALSLLPWPRVRDLTVYLLIGVLAGGPLGMVADAAPSRTEMTAHLAALDRALVAKGWPALSPWWSETVASFITSGKRQLVLRVGRRGGKSSSLSRLAVAYALYGPFQVPPGDIGWVSFVSVSRDEAAQRLRTITAILDGIGVAHEPAGDGGILVSGRRVGFRVLTPTVAGVSGWTSILVIADEVAKWYSRDTGANPAAEVLASLRPTLATTRGPIILASSPLTRSDEHAKSYDKGSTAHQMVAFAPTWIANPSVSEAETHALEPDERIHAREYGAEPQDEIIDGFYAGLIDGCIDVGRTLPTCEPEPGTVVIAIDAATRVDEFALCVARAELRLGGAPVVYVEWIKGWQGKPGAPLNMGDTLGEIAREVCGTFGSPMVIGDQHHEDSIKPILAQHSVHFEGIPWSATSKLERFGVVRTLMTDRRLRLLDDSKTLAQLRSVGVRMLPSGIETIATRGHDDRAFALVLAVTEALKRPAPSPRPTAQRMSDERREQAALNSAFARIWPRTYGHLAGRGRGIDHDAEELATAVGLRDWLARRDDR